MLALGFDAPAVTPRRIELPTPADASGPGTSLIVPRAGEVDVSTVPGPVTDSETARISLAPDGSVVGVAVTQTLTLTGVGDFNVVLPGPALHVVGPASQATQPGLRRGTILYQGFVPGTKRLVATATLDPALERFRVPLTVSLKVRQNGREVRTLVSGPVEIVATISNNTSRLVPVRDGVPPPGELASLLEALRDELRAGRAPIAGKRGMPASLASTSAVHLRRVPVTVPFALDGSIAFSSGTLSGIRVAGPGTPAASQAAFRATLPSAEFPDGTAVVTVTGEASRMGTPVLSMSALPTLPDAAELAPPRGSTWSSFLARADRDARRRALELAQTTMWRALRLPEFRAYLGNPGTGPSSTEYLYLPAPVAARRPQAPEQGVKAGAVVLALIAAALVVRNATVLWSRS